METIHIICAVIFGMLFLGCLIVPLWIHIEEKNNPEDKNGKSCLNFIIAVVLIIILMVLVGMCGSNTERSWEPRHTQLQKPAQNNVKSITFVSKALS